MVMDRLADRAGWAGKGRQRDASNVVGGRFRGLDMTLVKPLTYMNDSGLAVRKVLAREHAPLADLLIVADDFALPFGKLRFREGGGPAATTACARSSTSSAPRSSAGCGSASASRTATASTTSCRKFAPDERGGSTSCSTPRRTRSRRGHARARARPPTASTRSSCGPPTRTGSPRRARSTARRRRWHPPDEDRLATDPPGEERDAVAERATPPIRGRRGRDRRIAERVADEMAAAACAPIAARPSTSTRPRSTPKSRTPDDAADGGGRGDGPGAAALGRRARRGRSGAARRRDRPSAARPRRAAAAAGRDRVVRLAAGAARPARTTTPAGPAGTPG